MAQRFILGNISGFFDLANSTIAAEEPLTDNALMKIAANSRFAPVRCEFIYMGFYHHGDVVPTPFSPVDGYPYSREETQLLWTRLTTREITQGFLVGQALPPAQSNTQLTSLFWLAWDIDDSTGKVTLATSYFGPPPGGGDNHETQTQDGIVKVFAVCQRESRNSID